MQPPRRALQNSWSALAIKKIKKYSWRISDFTRIGGCSPAALLILTPVIYVSWVFSTSVEQLYWTTAFFKTLFCRTTLDGPFFFFCNKEIFIYNFYLKRTEKHRHLLSFWIVFLRQSFTYLRGFITDLAKIMD